LSDLVAYSRKMPAPDRPRVDVVAARVLLEFEVAGPIDALPVRLIAGGKGPMPASTAHGVCAPPWRPAMIASDTA